MKKQITELTDHEIDAIVSIMLGKHKENLIIERSDDRKFVIAEYKRERAIDDRTYDYVKMEITIDETFQVKNTWCYVNETPSKGPLGEGISNEPLYNYQHIAKYLDEKGYDVYGIERNAESNS